MTVLALRPFPTNHDRLGYPKIITVLTAHCAQILAAKVKRAPRRLIHRRGALTLTIGRKPMTKANQAYHKRDLYSDAAQVMTLANYYAKQAVKAQWQAQGLTRISQRRFNGLWRG